MSITIRFNNEQLTGFTDQKNTEDDIFYEITEDDYNIFMTDVSKYKYFDVVYQDTLKCVPDLLLERAYRSNIKLDILKNQTELYIKNLPQNEDKAKTIFLEWIENGSIGDKPEYWNQWKTARDVLAVKYEAYKTYLLDDARTLEEIDAWEWEE